MGIQIHPLPFMSALIVCLLTWQTVWVAASAVANPGVLAWCVGPLGLRVVPQRAPSALRLIWVTMVAGTALAVVGYACLRLMRPAPVTGLSQTAEGVAAALLVLVGSFVGLRIVLTLRELHYRLFGDARLITSVRQCVSAGGIVIFTRSGRTFVRERFSATPAEFIRLVTERDLPRPAQGA